MFFMNKKSGTKESAVKDDLTALKIPKHLGIIMDGNGRWAKSRGLSRAVGHKEGAKNVFNVAKIALKYGVETLSLYAFSVENWSRPKEEVDKLFSLIEDFYKNTAQKVKDLDIKLTVSGDLSVLPIKTQEIICEAMRLTEKNSAMTLNLLINYGGRQEIVRAVNLALKKGLAITEKTISDHLYTADFCDPELIIRTSGEQRLSNFLLYQSAYSEFYFTDVLWPDFDEGEFIKAIKNYTTRERRFGGITNE